MRVTEHVSLEVRTVPVFQVRRVQISTLVSRSLRTLEHPQGHGILMDWAAINYSRYINVEDTA